MAKTNKISDWGERRCIAEIYRIAQLHDVAQSRDVFGIGDDAALIWRGERDLCVSSDALIESVHFRHKWTTPRALGTKALAVNLSDLASMAARPVACFLTLGLPPSTPTKVFTDFIHGFCALAGKFRCILAGGDLTRARQWYISATVMGEVGPNGPALRSDARPGQAVYVTGRPGESAAGLAALEADIKHKYLTSRHNQPVPRIHEAAILTQLCHDLAMVDVSDGLISEMGLIAEASEVAIDPELMGFHPAKACRNLAAKLGVDPMDWVKYGGEDYELLFCTTTPLATLAEAFAKAGLQTPIHRVGKVVDAPDGAPGVIGEGAKPTVAFKHF